MKADKPTQLYSVQEAARYLALSRKSLWRLIHQRRISVIRINRRVLISETALSDIVDRHTIEKLDAESMARRLLGG